MRRIVGIVLCLMGCVGVISATAADTIRLALIEPLSGPFALQGETSLRHIQMAVDEINSSGGVLNGEKSRSYRSIIRAVHKRH